MRTDKELVRALAKVQLDPMTDSTLTRYVLEARNLVEQDDKFAMEVYGMTREQADKLSAKERRELRRDAMLTVYK